MSTKIFHAFISVFLVMVISFTGWSSALATDGTLDPTFGSNGKVTTDIGRDDGGGAVIIQIDGKIVVAGSTDNGAGLDFALARYNSEGSLDKAFGTNGIVATAFGSGHDISRAIVLQPDGKLIAAGDSFNGSTYDFALARYNSDGSLDSTFGTDGKVVTDLSAISRVNINTASAELIESLPGVGPTVAQRTVDYRNEHGPFESIEDILNVSGVGPMLFGLIKDLITVGSNDASNAVALQPDGKILLAGYSFATSDTDFALARYNSDGSPDLTFGEGGAVTTAIGSYFDYGMDMALQVDGKIIVAGYSDSATFGSDFTLARYNSDGSLDNSFDADGKVITDFNPEDFGFAVALQPDGKILLAGSSSHSNDRDFALLRYNSDGSLDLTFDSDGKVMTDFGGVYDESLAITLQQDGRIILAGHSGNTREDPRGDFALARYNPDGSLDTNFDTDGKVTTDFNSSSSDAGTAAVLQPDDKLIVAGSSDDNFALARYDAAASGAVEVSVPGTANPWLAGMPDGTISLFGDSAPENSPTQVPGLSLTPGASLSFSATGLISHGSPSAPLIETSGPDGGTNILSHDFGPENGISDIHAPINALLGVFLGPKQPDLSSTPDALDFRTATSRDYLSLAPQLQQVFFIGDGLTTIGQVQQISIPAGATRLFLGPMDASQYLNNEGSFSVQISNLPSIAVSIDILPGSQTNLINRNSLGTIPVAILASADFNAPSEVDRTSLTFSRTGDEHSLVSCNNKGKDVNGDGLLDLVCNFNPRLAGFQISDTVGILRGNTVNGIPIHGQDTVKIVKK